MMSNEQGLWEQFLQAWRDDVYLRLSIYGMVLFAVLCVINVLCWLRYGATISAMFDSKNNDESTSRVQTSDPIEGARSYYIPWQQETFPLSPETKKIEQATKKRQ